MNKNTVAIIFDSATKAPAITLLAALVEHHTLPIYITDSGKWLFYDSLTDNMKDCSWEKFGTNAILSPDKTHGGILRLVGDRYKALSCDVVWLLTQSINVSALCEMAELACITEAPKRTKPAILRQIDAACGGSK